MADPDPGNIEFNALQFLREEDPKDCLIAVAGPAREGGGVASVWRGPRRAATDSVQHLHVPLEVSLEREGLGAVGTDVGARGGVSRLMLAQVAPGLEAFGAGGTAVGSLLGVDPDVAAKAGAVHKSLRAHGAGVGPEKFPFPWGANVRIWSPV